MEQFITIDLFQVNGPGQKGAIYRLFADNPEKYEIDNARNILFQEINVGVDFGGK